MSQSPIDNVTDMDDADKKQPLPQPFSPLAGDGRSSTFDISPNNPNNYNNNNNNNNNKINNNNINNVMMGITPLVSTNAVMSATHSSSPISRIKCDETPCNKIFVGGLSWDTTQGNWSATTAHFGHITDCILMLDGATGRSRGFGFVTFLQHESVKSVLSIKQHILDNKIIDPKEAVPKHIKDIENRVNANQSNCHTSVVGSSNYSANNHIPTPGCISYGGCANECVGGNENGNVGMNGLISATITPTNNQINIKSLSTKPPITLPRRCPREGEPVVITTNPTPSSGFLCPNVVHNTKIFVGGIGHASESDLREYFSTFGQVVDVNIMMDKNNGRPRGFAFIGFSTIQAADLTASMRYHCIRNKQVEVKKALPKDTKVLSTSTNHINNTSTILGNNTTTSINSDTHHPNSHYTYQYPLNNKNDCINFTSYQAQIHSISNSKPNTIFDVSTIGHEHQPISNVVTPGLTANCSLVSGCSTVNDDRATNTLQPSTTYGGEWDFDDAMHLDDPNSAVMFANNAFDGVNSPQQHINHMGTNLNGVLATNDNRPIYHLTNTMAESFNISASSQDGVGGGNGRRSALLHHQENAFFGIQNNGVNGANGANGARGNLGSRESIFDIDYNANLSIAHHAGTLPTINRLQTPIRFGSVGDTATMLDRQIPDDTKNSIVELLNEIWK